MIGRSANVGEVAARKKLGGLSEEESREERVKAYRSWGTDEAHEEVTIKQESCVLPVSVSRWWHAFLIIVSSISCAGSASDSNLL